MAYTVRVAINRSALSLSPLTIDNTPITPEASGLWLPDGGVGEPKWDLRRTYAPESNWVAGRQLLAVVRDASALPLTIYARSTSSSGLQTVKAALQNAVAQFDYTVSVTVDGVVKTYRCEPVYPQWVDPDPGMVSAHMARATLTIPVN